MLFVMHYISFIYFINLFNQIVIKSFFYETKKNKSNYFNILRILSNSLNKTKK